MSVLAGFFTSSCGIMRLSRTKEENNMKGYLVGNGYMGLVDGRYMLFESERAYLEYLED